MTSATRFLYFFCIFGYLILVNNSINIMRRKFKLRACSFRSVLSILQSFNPLDCTATFIILMQTSDQANFFQLKMRRQLSRFVNRSNRYSRNCERKDRICFVWLPHLNLSYNHITNIDNITGGIDEFSPLRSHSYGKSRKTNFSPKTI